MPSFIHDAKVIRPGVVAPKGHYKNQHNERTTILFGKYYHWITANGQLQLKQGIPSQDLPFTMMRRSNV